MFLSVHARIHIACRTVRALFWPPDIGIYLFQLISIITKKNIFILKQSWLCTPPLSCTGPRTQVAAVHTKSSVSACLEKVLDFSFQLTQSVLTKDIGDQLNKFNFNVRGLCNGPCTSDECVRARLEFLNFSF